ncbi:MAG: ABC transporter permease [Actinomycetota bacterium]|nr:ABC transporter permease [Actinomycetota bacterium]
MSAAAPTPEEPGAGAPPSVAARLALYQRVGGIVTPLITAVLAFFIGGLVVLVVTGNNPLSTYKAIFDGTGLNWFFPWVHGAARTTAAYDLQSTLVYTTPLILTGLAVAFAFRAGLFNIGGQGQYAAGSIMAVWIGSSLSGMNGVAHIVLVVVVAALAGAAVAGLAGFLKATVGAHEVITTIMINWIFFWLAGYLFGVKGPLQNVREPSLTQSNDVVQSAKLHVFWGDPILRGLHIGLFMALAALVVYWLAINRTTLGYEVRAVGFNPEASHYAGISVARNYFLAMAISGMFAGLAGAIDVLGWKYHLAPDDLQGSTIGFIGIAVALLGRNSAVGVFFSALLFGSLIQGTSGQNPHLDPAIFKPEQADNLTVMIQGLILLFVGADVLVLYVWQARKKLRLRRSRKPEAEAEAST